MTRPERPASAATAATSFSGTSGTPTTITGSIGVFLGKPRYGSPERFGGADDDRLAVRHAALDAARVVARPRDLPALVEVGNQLSLPMTEEQLKMAPGPILHLPTVLGAVVPAYNIPGVKQELKFSGELLANIQFSERSDSASLQLFRQSVKERQRSATKPEKKEAAPLDIDVDRMTAAVAMSKIL